jgi:DNA-binding CsgD family transcriptional regulator
VRPGLSPRERQVLRLIASGQGDRQVGRALEISERTAKTHAANVMKKLEAATRAHAVDIGWRRGLLP